MMIGLAIGFLEAYFERKAGKLLDKAGHELSAAFDEKLSTLYAWIHGKFTGKPSAERSLRMLADKPDGKDQQDGVADELESVIGNDADAREASWSRSSTN